MRDLGVFLSPDCGVTPSMLEIQRSFCLDLVAPFDHEEAGNSCEENSCDTVREYLL